MGLLDQSGLVRLSDYRQLPAEPVYQACAAASRSFLKQNHEILKSYSHRWVADPFAQWSRQWEYPWVVHQLRARFPRGGARVLDAGSGLTFFPFHLSSLGFEVHGVDSDSRLESLFRKIAPGSSRSVAFRPGDLRKLPFADNFFDAIYCVSVLEHTDAYAEIVAEFHRVLRPGGLALITFDICVNGMADISPARAQELIRVLHDHFRAAGSGGLQFADLNRKSAVETLVNTEWFRKNDPSRMPWRWPRLSALKAGIVRGQLPNYIQLTFCTIAVVKDA